MMKAEEAFKNVMLPGSWEFKGYNHSRETDPDGDEHITAYGAVFFDKRTLLSYRLVYLIKSDRFSLVVKSTVYASATLSNRAGKVSYKALCNVRASELEKLNEAIRSAVEKQT